MINASIVSQVPYVNPNHHLPPRTLLTVKQFSQRNPSFSEASLRALIFNSKPRQSTTGIIPGNGLAEAIVRIGRKILVDEAKFYLWLDGQSNG
ncbi:hypothetical protein SAMN05216332_11141 [Nitrosospira briensis]|nr:hypothetical protein SAMN05216332_11141 [Nitrosospira briensis]